MRARRRAGAVLAALLLTLSGGMLAQAAPASAHAFLAASTPGDGASLASAPRELRLDFSESVVIAATHIDVVDAAGRHVQPTDVRLVGADPTDTEVPSHVLAALPPLPRGAYRVSWQTLSSDDLHTTSGVLAFGIGAAVAATPFREPVPKAQEAALRWAVLGGLALALGGLLAARLRRRCGLDGSRARRVALAGAAGGALVAVALLLQQTGGSGASAERALAGAYGWHWGLREAGLAVLVVAAAARRGRVPLTVLGAGAACLGSALLGHASAAGPTRVAADAAHLAAVATWAGALLVLAPAAVRHRDARAVLRAFGVPAAACVTVGVVTGCYLASGVVGSVDAALYTVYGRVLLLKIAVFGLAGLLGLGNSLRLRRRGTALGRAVVAEAALAALLLGLAGVLTSGQPAREPQLVATRGPATVPVVTAAVRDLQESLALRPNRPGRSVAVVDVFQTRRPVLGPVQAVLVQVGDPAGRLGPPVRAQQIGDGRWSAPVELARPGLSLVRVDVVRPGLPVVGHVYRWTVGGVAVPVRAARVSTAPVGAALRGVALALALLAALGWGVAAARRTGRRAAPGRWATAATTTTATTAPTAPAAPAAAAAPAADRPAGAGVGLLR